MLQGYVKRQAIYACLTCCPDAKMDEIKRAGVCLACSLHCHENHELIELYTKRNFRCDCGNPKIGSQSCIFTPEKTDLNYDNRYNQNFSGLYCICHRPYPDPEATDEEEMIQCVICEDWLHENHLEATVPNNDQYSEMVCKACMEDNDFLHDYSDIIINVVDKEIIVTDPDLDVTIDDTNEATKEAEDIFENTKQPESTEEQAENEQKSKAQAENKEEESEAQAKIKEQESESQAENKDQDTEAEDENKEQETEVQAENKDQESEAKLDYENKLESVTDNKVKESLLEMDQKPESERNTENEMEADADSSGGNDALKPKEVPLIEMETQDTSEDNDISKSTEVPTSEAEIGAILGDMDISERKQVVTSGAEIKEIEKANETDNENLSESTEVTKHDSTNSIESKLENDATDAVTDNKDNTVCKDNILDNKRKLETDRTEDHTVKKQKLEDTKPCVRPRGVKRVYKGATFWPTFRQKLCTCGDCIAMYKDLGALFLIDQDDTVTAYEALGKANAEGPSSQYEKGLQALSSLDRVQQINALTEYNKLRDKLIDFLQSFKDRQEVVKEEDIKAFFAGMKPRREPDGVYFCR